MLLTLSPIKVESRRINVPQLRECALKAKVLGENQLNNSPYTTAPDWHLLSISHKGMASLFSFKTMNIIMKKSDTSEVKNDFF